MTTPEDGTNFTPRIVRYAGMHPLPGGERWGYPSGAAGVSARGVPFRGGRRRGGVHALFRGPRRTKGLHRFYDGQVRREASRERIILSLRLAPHEFEALLTPGTGAPDIRSVFRIDTGAGVVRAAAARRWRLRPGESLGALHVQPPHGRLMTRHDELSAEAVLREVRGLTTRQAVLRLFGTGAGQSPGV